MTLPELSIKRPVFATVMSLVLVLVGLVSFGRLSVREYPAIDPPVITVETDYPGASAAIVETQVTKVLEDSLAGIEGIDFITSISRQESSQITVTFKLDRNPDYAAADIRDRVGRVRGHLPEEIDEPIIQKREADAQPIMFLAFSSKRHSALEITDYADRYVKDQLTTLDGVAEVRLYGDRAYSMRIWLDPERLAAYQLTPQDVEDALRRQNVEVPSGRIESQQREFTVLAETDLRTPEQFNDLIIKDANGYLVRLSDVGKAEIGALDERKHRPLQRPAGHCARRHQAGDRQSARSLRGRQQEAAQPSGPRCPRAWKSASRTTSRSSSPSRSRTSTRPSARPWSSSF